MTTPVNPKLHSVLCYRWGAKHHSHKQGFQDDCSCEPLKLLKSKQKSQQGMTTEGLSPAARAQRLSLGVLTLLLVDVIWVGSSELTEYIFKEQNFNKPFFSTYLKTSLFMLYLPGFVVHRPWREQCWSGFARRQERRGEGYTRLLSFFYSVY